MRAFDPVSIFISRQTQTLYVRRPFQPIWESPVTILDADRPVATHVFTALERMNGERTSGDAGVRWSAVTLDDGRPRAAVAPSTGPRARRPCSGRRAGPDGPGRREERARPHCHSARGIGSDRRDDVAAIVPDHLRRGVERGDRKGHGLRDCPERRAAGRHQIPATQLGAVESVLLRSCHIFGRYPRACPADPATHPTRHHRAGAQRRVPVTPLRGAGCCSDCAHLIGVTGTRAFGAAR